MRQLSRAEHESHIQGMTLTQGRAHSREISPAPTSRNCSGLLGTYCRGVTCCHFRWCTSSGSIPDTLTEAVCIIVKLLSQNHAQLILHLLAHLAVVQGQEPAAHAPKIGLQQSICCPAAPRHPTSTPRPPWTPAPLTSAPSPRCFPRSASLQGQDTSLIPRRCA